MIELLITTYSEEVVVNAITVKKIVKLMKRAVGRAGGLGRSNGFLIVKVTKVVVQWLW